MPNAYEPVKIIQVGAGGMGRSWLATLAESTEVELVGLVDLDADVARQAADLTGHSGCPVSTSLSELVRQVRAQAVVNVTVPAAHRVVNLEAMFAGLPVLCEKPAAPTVAEALSMVAAAEATGQLLMISQSRRYWNHLAAFKGLLTGLGPVGSVDCQFYRAPHFGGFREQMAQPLLVDMAIHQFDLARYLLDDDPTAVYCETFNPSWSWFAGDASAAAVFEFSSGARFTFTGSWCAAGMETSWNGRWRVSAEHGTALWNGDDAPVTDVSVRALTGPAAADRLEQIAGSLAEFVAALRTGKRPATNVRANVLSLAMVEGAVRSAAAGERVLISAVLEAAYEDAVRSDQPPEVRAVLTSWRPVVD